MSFARVLHEIREVLAGRMLARAMDRNRRAAEGLDAAVREMLRGHDRGTRTFRAGAQMVVPLVGAQKGWRGWMAVAEPAATTQFLLIGFSFAALTYAFVTSDFSLRLVVLNSHTLKPMIYKITGVWGNHEGSLLLWVLILALFGARRPGSAATCPPRCGRGCWRCRR
jgi:hypothetical protein